MKITGIYKIQSTIKPERFYIGSSVNVFRRWQGHLSELKRDIHHSKKLQRHFNKYGESDLQFSILLGCDRSMIIEIEQYFLDSYNPYFNNLLKANPVKYLPHSEETKKKMSERRKGKKLSEETRKKISESHKGIKPNEATREKLRLSHLGQSRKQSKEHIEKRTAKIRGIKRTDEVRKKLSNIKRGKVAWNKGKKFINGKYV